MTHAAILLALAATVWALLGAPAAAVTNIYGNDGTWRIGRHIIPPRVSHVDPRSFRLHPRPDPAPNGMPGPVTGPSGGSIGGRPYGIGYFFLDATQRRRGGAEERE